MDFDEMGDSACQSPCLSCNGLDVGNSESGRAPSRKDDRRDRAQHTGTRSCKNLERNAGRMSNGWKQNRGALVDLVSGDNFAIV